MRLTIKAGKEQIFNTAIDGDKIIINLQQRWPASAAFNRKTQEFVIQVTAQSPAIRIRPSHPIEVGELTVEKDQVVAYYRKPTLTQEADEAGSPAP